MKVKNVESPPGLKYTGEWWLQYWKSFSQRKTKVCTAKSCINKDLVGALVEKSNDNDKATYVVPLCQQHRKANDEFELIIGTRLVLVEADLMV